MRKIILGLSVAMLICTLSAPAYAAENETNEETTITVTTDEEGNDTTVYTDPNGNTITITDLGEDVDEADIDLDDDFEEDASDVVVEQETESETNSEGGHSKTGSAVVKHSSGIRVEIAVICVLLICGGIWFFKRKK